jgi:hypothetical protein
MDGPFSCHINRQRDYYSCPFGYDVNSKNGVMQPPKRHAMLSPDIEDPTRTVLCKTLLVLLPLVFQLLNICLAIPRIKPLALKPIPSIHTVPAVPRSNSISIRLERTLV